MEIVSHKGDITELDVDAIVNAANSDLWMGSGVAGAIKSKGGKIIEEEAMEQGPIQPGEAVITTAGNLPAEYVIHAAGMPPGGKATKAAVMSSVKSSLELALQNELQTIAFPVIGAGVGGLTVEESIQSILSGISQLVHPKSIKKIILVGYGAESYSAIRKTLES